MRGTYRIIVVLVVEDLLRGQVYEVRLFQLKLPQKDLAHVSNFDSPLTEIEMIIFLHSGQSICFPF